MVRRVTPSQLNSMVRKAQQKQRQAIDKFNREVRGYNQKAKRVVDNYNREVRTHNARVRADRQRLKNELIRLNRQPVTARLMTFRTSVSAVQTAHKRLEHAADVSRFDARYNEILDLSERETANSAGLMNALLGDAEPPDELLPNAPDSLLIPVLHAISADLSDRWRGALFSLNLSNPDAARHFCTSAREIITRILDTKAPDSIVTGAMPGCDCTPRGKPTRRAKIRYFLHQKGMEQNELEAFVETDMDNVVDLFQVFNEGTHGSAGNFGLTQLQAIRKRVEDAIMFLSGLVS